MRPILLAGVGPGREDMLTLQVREAIDGADAVFAFERHRVLSERALPLEPLSTARERILAEARDDRRVVVLVSGDPCLYSLLGLMKKWFGEDGISVLPGIGAVQTFCARMGVLWQDARIVSGHGRELTVSALGHAVRTNGRVILFCDAQRDAAWAARALLAEGLVAVRMCVGERLSYPEERLTRGLPAELAEVSLDPLCLVWFENDAPVAGLPPIGLSDECFTRGRIPMTKREIRMQVLAELALTPDSVVWDLGAGTGSVSVECARQCPLGSVYAVEQKTEGVELIRTNAERLHVNNLTAIEGIAPEACVGLPVPTHVFIGGSSGQLKQMLALLRGFGKPIRVVATAVTLESMGELSECFTEEHMSEPAFSQLAVSRVPRVGRYHLMQALNPVLIASGTIRTDEEEQV